MAAKRARQPRSAIDYETAKSTGSISGSESTPPHTPQNVPSPSEAGSVTHPPQFWQVTSLSAEGGAWAA